MLVVQIDSIGKSVWTSNNLVLGIKYTSISFNFTLSFLCVYHEHLACEQNMYYEHLAYKHTMYHEHLAYEHTMYHEHLAYKQNVYYEHLAYEHTMYHEHLAYSRICTMNT